MLSTTRNNPPHLLLVQLLLPLPVLKQRMGMLKQVLANLDPISSLLERGTKAEEIGNYFSASKGQAHAFSLSLSYMCQKKMGNQQA